MYLLWRCLVCHATYHLGETREGEALEHGQLVNIRICDRCGARVWPVDTSYAAPEIKSAVEPAD
jgi:hypothetical protein